MSRGPDATRAIYSERVEKIVELIAKVSPAQQTAKKRAEALHILSACVGAVTCRERYRTRSFPHRFSMVR